MQGRQSETSPGSRDIALVKSFFEAFEAQDVERALGYMSEDIVYQNVPFPAARGKAAVRRTLEMFGRFMTGFKVKMKNIAARVGVVLTERVDILRGPGIYLDLWVCGTFEVKDATITLWRDYFDLAYLDFASGPFYGFNRPGAQASQGVIQNWWRQAMSGSAKAHYDGIKVFSETDFTEDLKNIRVPTLVMHGDDDQIVPIADSALLSAKLLKDGTLKVYRGFPHGMCTTHADAVNADLLAFAKE